MKKYYQILLLTCCACTAIFSITNAYADDSGTVAAPTLTYLQNNMFTTGSWIGSCPEGYIFLPPDASHRQFATTGPDGQPWVWQVSTSENACIKKSTFLGDTATGDLPGKIADVIYQTEDTSGEKVTVHIKTTIHDGYSCSMWAENSGPHTNYLLKCKKASSSNTPTNNAGGDSGNMVSE